MRISNSAVMMDSNRTYQTAETPGINALRQFGGSTLRGLFDLGSSQFSFNDLLCRGSAARAADAEDWFGALTPSSKGCVVDLLLELLRRMTGKDMVEELLAIPVKHGKSSARAAWTRQVVRSEFVQGEEHTAFTSTGTAATEDGRCIDFSLTVEMSRSFEDVCQVVETEVFTDPLVINLDTCAPALSGVSFYFDLDCDGRAEELSALAPGSSFLALDKNGDGVINNGSELFGARTGNGFAELAQYDQDGNGWIDENDEVFSRLSVWVRYGGGKARLLSLRDAGVGAICLSSQATQFSLTGPDGAENAIIRRTGVYLSESGFAGTIQHIDLRNLSSGARASR